MNGAAAVRKAGPPSTVLARVRSRLTEPAAVFVALSLLFGALTIALTPPLRGPDERAHFVRAYSVSIGSIVPTVQDAHGRKGTFLPRFLHDEVTFYEDTRRKVGTPGFNYRNVISQRQEHRPAAEARDTTPIFILYEGSEGYSPVPYLPYSLVILVARALNLDFLPTLYLARVAGFALWTAVIAYAITTTPVLKWAFPAIAMLPSALYGRAIISADGAVLASTLLIVAFSLKCVFGGLISPAARAFWITVSALSKPPQITFVLLEGMVTGWRALSARWRTALLVVLPALVLAPLWSALSGDGGSWRYVVEGEIAPEQFDPVWKAKFLLDHPLHFPSILAATVANLGEWFWHQLIGVLGWLDTPLQRWAYPTVTALLLASWLEPLGGSRGLRTRVFAVSALTTAAYTLVTLLVLFLAITTTADKTIEGLQGRYFLVVLPLFATMTGALLRRGLPRVAALSAAGCAVVSGLAVIEAILRVDWSVGAAG